MMGLLVRYWLLDRATDVLPLVVRGMLNVSHRLNRAALRLNGFDRGLLERQTRLLDRMAEVERGNTGT